jgi:hypothetical protein
MRDSYKTTILLIAGSDRLRTVQVFKGGFMKQAVLLSIVALTLASCAPASRNMSSSDVAFVPARGASLQGSGSIASGNGSTTLRLQFSGLPANATLGTGIYVGSCTNQGHLKIATPDITSDASGNGTLETTIMNGTLPAQAYINVHQKASEAGYGSAIACANLTDAK